jgi:hypothetical protein
VFGIVLRKSKGVQAPLEQVRAIRPALHRHLQILCRHAEFGGDEAKFALIDPGEFVARATRRADGPIKPEQALWAAWSSPSTAWPEGALIQINLNPAVEANRQAEIHLESTRSVISAQAETHGKHIRRQSFFSAWIPAFAGMTAQCVRRPPIALWGDA